MSRYVGLAEYKFSEFLLMAEDGIQECRLLGAYRAESAYIISERVVLSTASASWSSSSLSVPWLSRRLLPWVLRRQQGWLSEVCPTLPKDWLWVVLTTK